MGAPKENQSTRDFKFIFVVKTLNTAFSKVAVLYTIKKDTPKGTKIKKKSKQLPLALKHYSKHLYIYTKDININT